MYNLNKTFSISDVVVDRNVEDKDFAIMELYCLAEGQNSHRNPISREVLTAKENVDTFKGKFVIGKYDKWTQDVRSHEVQEDLYGYISVTEDPQFKTKVVDGEEKLFVVCKAYISKIYCKEIVDMFQVDNKRSVSCEFSCALQYDEDEYGRPLDEFGNPMDIDNPILAYSISGVTLLSKKVNPSVKGADAVMKRFSEDSNKLKETESKEETMEENREFSEQPKDEDIVMEQVGEEEVKNVKGDTEVDEVEGEKEMEMAETDSEEKVEEDNKEMGCGEDKEMSETVEMAEENPQVEEEKSFSEQAVELADEEHKEFVEKLFSSELKDMIEQIVELKKFMETTIKTNTEKRFSEIMVEPKLCLGEKAYNVLFEEGSKLTLNELDAFEQKVKAFCEDAPKKQENNDDMLKFSCGNIATDKSDNLDVWSRIENN